MKLDYCAMHSGAVVGDQDMLCLVIRHDDGRAAKPREVWAEIDRLRARVAEFEAERDDDDALRERMSDILKRTAIALRGPEPPLTAWSWHDLPERAAAAIASIDLFQRVAHNLADPRGLVPMLVDRFLAWKLPEDFAPDGGISFTLISKDHPEWWPTGTCLLNAPQATAMFEYLLGIDGATGEECFTGQLVEIDGNTYGLRPGAARVVKEAMQDAGRAAMLESMLACEREKVTNAVRLLTEIHSLLYPAHITAEDGRVWAFRPRSIDPHEVLQEVSDRIRELPEKIAAMAKDGAP